MTALLLSALFVGTGLIAVVAMGMSWRHHGKAAMALPAQVTVCEELREVRVRVSEVRVNRNATVLRPDFTAAGRQSAARSTPTALPAAA